MRLLACVAVIFLFAFPTVAQELTVAAASDLTYAMPELAAAFKARIGATLKTSLGSSGNFYAQISNGAPFDVFLSADVDYPHRLAQAGLADPATETIYARGTLALWIPSAKAPLSPRQLLTPEIRKIAIANPQHAPYGRAALAALRQLNLLDEISPRLVYGENIAQTAQFVSSGSAQAGLVAVSLLISNPAAQDHWTPLPDDSYAPIQQSAIVLRSSRNPQLARAFLTFLKTSEAETILKRHGFRR